MAGTITALRYQKRSRERVNVYLDGAFAFALPALVAATLRRGQHLSDAEIERLQALDAEQRAYDRCLRYLGRRSRSTAEVRRYLQRIGVSQPTAEAVVERLAAAGYLDDQAFAAAWVADRERFRPRSQAALRRELRQKGVAESAIARALDHVDDEENAYRAARPRAQRLQGLDARAFRQKLGGFLLRRGFSHEVVWPVVAQLWQEVHGQGDDQTELDWHEI